jgi:hypothetical protein
LAREAAVMLKETIILAGKAYLDKVPVEMEVTVAKTWAEK